MDVMEVGHGALDEQLEALLLAGEGLAHPGDLTAKHFTLRFEFDRLAAIRSLLQVIALGLPLGSRLFCQR